MSTFGVVQINLTQEEWDQIQKDERINSFTSPAIWHVILKEILGVDVSSFGSSFEFQIVDKVVQRLG